MNYRLTAQQRRVMVRFASRLVAHLNAINGDSLEHGYRQREQIKAELRDLGRILWSDNQSWSS